MQFHIEFDYETEDREKLFNFLGAGAIGENQPLKVIGAWVALETGTSYAIIETEDASALFNLCSDWSEYGIASVTPVLSMKKLADIS